MTVESANAIGHEGLHVAFHVDNGILAAEPDVALTVEEAVSVLADAGHAVVNPKLDDDDFAAAVQATQAEYDQHQPDVIVGSSGGGAVAMNIKSKDTPPGLLCPARKKWGTTTTIKRNGLFPCWASYHLDRTSSILVVVPERHRSHSPEQSSAAPWR